MPINNQKMLQSIYDTLFSGYVQPPDGAGVTGANASPRSVYLCLEWPGKQISEADMGNAWNPNNTQGSVYATELFSTIVDDVPSAFPMFTPTGAKVSDIYRLITQATYVPPPLSPQAKDAYDKADALLWMDAPDYDDAGKPITVKKPHPLYVAYKKAALAYTNELTKFLQQYLGLDMGNKDDQRKWSILGPQLRKPVDAAWDDWTAARKEKIEDALAALAQNSNNQIGRAFSEAQKRLTLLEKAGVNDPGKKWYASYPTPGNWFAPSAADEWTKATITSNKSVKNEHSDYSESSMEAGASYGLWSASGGFSKSDSHEHMDETTDNLEVSFSYAKVDIDRPWLNAVLMGLQGWSIPNQAPRSFSDGTKTQSGTLFPLLPVAFVAVRNLSIKADWGHKDVDTIKKKLEAKASFGWGPFAVSGNHAEGSTDHSEKSEFDGRTITNNGLQIVAWICAVNPLCPPVPQPVPKGELERASAA